jgi:hypothetical protein
LYVTIPPEFDLVVSSLGVSSNDLEAVAGAIIPKFARQLTALEPRSG